MSLKQAFTDQTADVWQQAAQACERLATAHEQGNTTIAGPEALRLAAETFRKIASELAPK